MRPIDADALLKKAHYRETGDLNGEYVLFPSDVEVAPTIDAVPVVRCKDCKYCETAYCSNRKTISKTEVYCSCFDQRCNNNDFCSRGVKKDEVSDVQMD